ncbi:MAG: hypothetical protein JRD89_00980 [Deltaproteobacteria bacterium]|nr:hypothetical protein [Deltaproteobacteria bacterium]
MKLPRPLRPLTHPLLWAIPFSLLIGFHLPLLLTNGLFAKSPLPLLSTRYFRPFNTLNVILFSFIWIWSAFHFHRRGYPPPLCTYLAFMVMFGCYGVIEVWNHIVWFPQYVARLGLMKELHNMVYPVIFLLCNVPVCIFTKLKQEDIAAPAVFLIFSLSLFLIFRCYIAYGLSLISSDYATAILVLRETAQPWYLGSRAFSVLAYAYVVWKNTYAGKDMIKIGDAL